MTVLNIVRGDDEEFDLALFDKDGQPMPLSSAYLTFTVKQFSTDSDDDALIVKMIGDGITIVDANEGTATLDIDSADTTSSYFPSTRKGLLWDLQVLTGSGKRKTLDKGTLNVDADITRD